LIVHCLLFELLLTALTVLYYQLAYTVTLCLLVIFISHADQDISAFFVIIGKHSYGLNHE